MRLLIFISVGVLATSAFGQSQAKLKEQIAALKAEQRADYKAVLKNLEESRNTANGLHDNLVQAQSQVNKIGTERDGWRDYGNAQHDLWLGAEKRVAEQKVGKLKWMGAFFGLAVLVGTYFGLKFFTPLRAIL